MPKVLLTIFASLVCSCAAPGVCPPIIEYEPEFQEQLAGELDRLPSDYEAVPWVIQDYRMTREQLETCQ